MTKASTSRPRTEAQLRADARVAAAGPVPDKLSALSLLLQRRWASVIVVAG